MGFWLGCAIVKTIYVRSLKMREYINTEGIHNNSWYTRFDGAEEKKRTTHARYKNIYGVYHLSYIFHTIPLSYP